jgi:hypothetical protein
MPVREPQKSYLVETNTGNEIATIQTGPMDSNALYIKFAAGWHKTGDLHAWSREELEDFVRGVMMAQNGGY